MHKVGKKLAIFVSLSLSMAATAQSNFFDKWFCGGKDKSGGCSIYSVSIINLKASPEILDEKAVRVYGYLNVGSEDVTLSLAKDSSPGESVWLSLYEGKDFNEHDLGKYKNRIEELKKLDGKRVIVEGIFDIDIQPAIYHGGIKNIRRLDAI